MAKDVGIVKVVGVEHDKAACKCLIRSGIECYEDITDVPPPRRYTTLFLCFM